MTFSFQDKRVQIGALGLVVGFLVIGGIVYRSWNTSKMPTGDTRYSYCEPLFGDPANAAKGWLEGCCGPYASTDAAPRKTLIKGTRPTVYYYAANGKRYVFPFSKVMASWVGPYGKGNEPAFDSTACSQVVQLTDKALGEIPIGGNVEFRPGTVVTGIESDTRRYVVDRGHTLRPLERLELASKLMSNIDVRTVLLPEPFFTNYVIGSPVGAAADYSATQAFKAKIDEEL